MRQTHGSIDNACANFPVLTSATATSGSTVVMGTLSSTPNTTFRIEFFADIAVSQMVDCKNQKNQLRLKGILAQPRNPHVKGQTAPFLHDINPHPNNGE